MLFCRCRLVEAPLCTVLPFVLDFSGDLTKLSITRCRPFLMIFSKFPARVLV